MLPEQKHCFSTWDSNLLSRWRRVVMSGLGADKMALVVKTGGRKELDTTERLN